MQLVWNIIRQCLRAIWFCIKFIREFVVTLLVLLLVIFVVVLFRQQSTPPAQIPKGALLVNLSGVIVDNESTRNRFAQLGQDLLGNNANQLQENNLFDIVSAIRQAQNDKRISGLVLALNNLVGADQPSLRYLGKSLAAFKKSGKPIYAIGDNYSQAQYYLASFANNIYLSPMGNVDLHGLASNTLYYKTLLDTLQVNRHIFRVGTYKSAVEPLIRDDMSDAARQADSHWINQLWQHYLMTVAENRHLTPEQFFPEPSKMVSDIQATQGDLAQYAVKQHWVDKLLTRPEQQQQLAKQFGWNSKKSHFNAISIYDYNVTQDIDTKGTNSQNKIAIIFANGAIIDGRAGDNNVGGDTTAAQIRRARLNANVKAIILRINSPGGSVNASEVIRNELLAVHNAGKPIVVSMGGMAASGGYWIATPADKIIADPTTLTGSIGIFGVINTYEKSLSTIGIHSDGVATSPLAQLNATQALPDQYSQIMQATIEHGYQTFLSIVGQARHKTPEQVDQIAQGRVWTGQDALANGLIDQLGDFDDAVQQAASLAKINQWQLDWLAPPMSWYQMVLSQINASINSHFSLQLSDYLPAPLGQVANHLQQQTQLLNQFNDPQNRYAFCLTCGKVE